MSATARRLLRALVLLAILLSAERAFAQDKRAAGFTWNAKKSRLYVTVGYRDVINDVVLKRLERGLPVTIVMTGAIYEEDKSDPVATTAQTCRVTKVLWSDDGGGDEYYQIKITRPGFSRVEKSAAIGGIVRRCAETHKLLAGTSAQVTPGASVYMTGKVQVDPVSQETMEKIRRWVTRPSGTGTAAPGDALFSTFTDFFLNRIGDAEVELKFTTETKVPNVEPPPPPPAKPPPKKKT